MWGWRDAGHGVGWFQMQTPAWLTQRPAAAQQEQGRRWGLRFPRVRWEALTLLDQRPWEKETEEMKGCTVLLL